MAATIQLIPSTTINGTTYTQLILTPVSPKRKQSKTILPKQEPASPSAETSLETKWCTNESARQDCSKRRIHFSKKALTHPRPQAVTRRNTRERNRVRAVNQGFVTLANHVPANLRSKKMSKVDTLKAAIDYIHRLQDALDTNTDLSDTFSDSESSTDSISSAVTNTDSIPSTPPCTSTSPQQPDSTSLHHFYRSMMADQNTAPQSYHGVCNSNFHTDGYQPQCTEFYSPATSKGGFNIDYTRPSHNIDNSCPSPSSSYASTQEFQKLQHLTTAEAEAEILEFASSWLY